MSELALLDPSQLLFLVFFGFMAAFIDSIVGGGGLISVPALMWTGLPPVSLPNGQSDGLDKDLPPI